MSEREGGREGVRISEDCSVGTVIAHVKIVDSETGDNGVVDYTYHYYKSFGFLEEYFSCGFHETDRNLKYTYNNVLKTIHNLFYLSKF